MELVVDFDEKSYNNNGKQWKSSRILRVKSKVLHFSFFFHIFLHFSLFFIFPFSFFSICIIFSFFHFSCFGIFPFFCSFSFFHVLSFSLFFFFLLLFHFLSFSFIFLGAQNVTCFGASISLRFLLTLVL